MTGRTIFGARVDRLDRTPFTRAMLVRVLHQRNGSFRRLQGNPVTVRDSLVPDDEVVGVRTGPGEDHLPVTLSKLDERGEVVDVDHGLAGRAGHRLDVHEQLGVAALDVGATSDG